MDTISQLAEQIRMIYMTMPDNANSMTLDKVLSRLSDYLRETGKFVDRCKYND